jgi:hypothetical protein
MREVERIAGHRQGRYLFVTVVTNTKERELVLILNRPQSLVPHPELIFRNGVRVASQNVIVDVVAKLWR